MSLSSKNIEAGVAALSSGKILLCPTDTIWGLSCNPFDEQALEAIFKLKNRSKEKSFILLVSSKKMLMEYAASIPVNFEDLNNQPTTIIYDETKNLPDFILAKDKSIGIRMVQDVFANKLIEAFGKPIVSTSANVSGEPSPQNFSSISATIKEGVGFIVSEALDTSNNTQPSRIIKLLADGTIHWIRR